MKGRGNGDERTEEWKWGTPPITLLSSSSSPEQVTRSLLSQLGNPSWQTSDPSVPSVFRCGFLRSDNDAKPLGPNVWRETGVVVLCTLYLLRIWYESIFFFFFFFFFLLVTPAQSVNELCCCCAALTPFYRRKPGAPTAEDYLPGSQAQVRSSGWQGLC